MNKHMVEGTVFLKHDLSRDMRFPTMWYIQPAKPQISLRIRQSDQNLF